MSALNRLRTAGALWLLCAAVADAQHWNFQHYGSESGLKNPTVFALHQDQQGFVWASTEGGLFRYDGDSFRSFEAGVPGKVAGIASLHTSRDGRLWAASLGGIFRWTGDSFVPAPALGNLEVESAEGLASDSKYLYVASLSGLWRVPLGGGGNPERLSTEAAASVFVAGDQRVWFGCGSSLCVLKEGAASQADSAAGLPHGPWSSIVEDSKGRLWIRSAEQVMVKPGKDGRFTGVSALASTHSISLVPSRYGEVMVPHTGGLAMCTPKGCRNFSVESGLEHAESFAALEDREGSVWIGYSGHGLTRWLGREEWQSFSEPEGLEGIHIWRIVRDGSGNLWVGTNHGVFRGVIGGPERGGRWRFERSDVVGQWSVYGLLADPDGSLWVGTYESGLNGLVHYDPGSGRKTIYPPARPQARFSINGLARDRSGTIWVCSGKQIMRLRPGAKYLETVELPISGSSIYSILILGDDLYVAGRKGLYVEHAGIRRVLTTKDGLKDQAVQSVTEGPGGEIWIAYYEPVGLSRLDWTGGALHLRHFTTAEGLASNVVYSQFFDARGRHWLATDSGVAVQDGNGWLQYDTSNGLIWNDCNAGAYLAEPDGTVWVGTSAGLSRYSPVQRIDPPVPLTIVTEVMRNDQLVTSSLFDSNTHTVALRFTMLAYRQQNPTFRYRLGRDNAWIQTNARAVHFAELRPGAYHFEVQGEVGRGVWSHAAERDFSIRPAWYLAEPYPLLAAALAGALIWLGWHRHELTQKRLRERLEAAVEERTRGLAAATERAEQESRFKGEFLANMSHEMRTPLNGVLGLTKLALELSNQPEVVSYLSTVQFSAKVLLALINDVLDLAKIEAGMMEIVPVAFAPRLLLEEVRCMMDTDARNKGLALQTAVAEDVPEWIHADDSRLRQILVNLIGNATKFTQSGGVTVGLEHDGERLHCSVTDTGMGIAPEKQAIIFDVFRQADNSTSRRHGGSGLGLAISRKLVESMGGSIQVNSAPGCGSTFSFCIAAKKSSAPAIEVAASPEAPGRPLRILVAEDNKVNQRLIIALLERRGHSATVACNGREALSLYQQHKFDLILMDIQMPEMDGIEAVRHIRELEAQRGTRIPVVAVTARAMLGDRAEIMAAGMDDSLEKPIRTEQLEAILGRYSRLQPALPEFETVPHVC